MADIYSREKRKEIMSSISGKETKPEILVRKFLFSRGFRYRKNDKRYPGRPDIVLPKHKTIIFVHGCFWHGHQCKKGNLPKTNTEVWREKIARNQERDLKNKISLEELGWKVIEVWGCEIKNVDLRDKRLNHLLAEIKNSV